MLWFLLLLLMGGGLALLLVGDTQNILGLDPATFASLLGLGALLVAISYALLGSYCGRLFQAFKDLATWTAIAFLLVLAYSYREEASYLVQRVAGELLPPGEAVTVEGTAKGEQAVRIRRRMDGHFIARTQINGATVGMLVDTGASTVVLTTADAQKAGIDLAQLAYTVPVQTANGAAFAAPVRLRRLAIGPIAVNNVDALVAQPGVLRESLLGMNFLRRLRSYEFSGEYLTLRS
jgi:aspartyl protease family protein